MRFCLLGTTQAHHDDGTPVALGGARLRALLTVLAQRAGRTVPVAVLVDEVWEDDPPADAHGAVQALVGRLRRALGPDAVASAESGYRLCADADDVDLHRFDRLAGEGTQALADGDAAKAAALLDDALALWRGPVLADLPDRTAAAARWEARRLEARRARLAAALALGRADEALPELADLCEAHPLDEPLQTLHIQALRDSGRQAQALAAYEEVRRRLADRLGADPGPELRALQGRLLAPEAPSARGNLPARLTSFVGRGPDLREIRDDLSRARLVTLLGPGGSGKTRLSLEAAEAAAHPDSPHPDTPWPDGIWLAELAPVNDPDTVPEAVLTALGARETVLRGAGAEELRAVDRHGDDPVVRLAEHCARRRMLLLLDNCEHLVEAAATLAERLLAHCPGLTILATSREPLGVPGERVRPVDPLPDPMALRLLADRGAAARPGFRVDGDEATAAACEEICRRLDGLPLAIELAAARLRMLTPRQIADRLDDRFRLLTSGARTVLPRQQTLRAVVDWSWDLLDAPERAVLRRLAVFAGGCDLPAAESVCAGPAHRGESPPPPGTSPSHPAATASEAVPWCDVTDVVGSLVDKSLVVAAPDHRGHMRYRLLETVAEYAAGRLDEARERSAVERRHLVHYRELARSTDPLLRGPGQRDAVDRLELEYENLRTALRRAVEAHDEHEVLCLVLSLGWYWQMRDLRAEARHWSGAAAGLGPDPFGPGARPAPPLDERCIDAPPPMRQEILEEARRGVALMRMATMEHGVEDWTTPQRQVWLRSLVGAYRPGLPQTCRFPGSLWFFALMMTGEVDLLMRVLDESVRVADEKRLEWELAGALQMRANVFANRSESAAAALRDANRSLEIYERIGDGWGAAEALSVRGEAYEQRGEYEQAAADYATAVGHARILGAQSQIGVLRTRYAAAILETGRGEEGEAILREVLAGSAPQMGHEGMPMARLFLAVRLGRTGRTAEAREHLALLLDEFRTDTLAFLEGVVVGCVAWLDVLDGRHAEALEGLRAAMEHALTPLSMMIAPHAPATHLLTTAMALTGLGGEERVRCAARLIGAYAVLVPPAHVPTPLERENRVLGEHAARAALGDAAFEAAYAEGGGLGLEEATALARDAR